jgi:Ca-activated chloride channel family protein
VALLVASAALAAPLVAQRQQPTFRTGIQTVPVYATVTDENGDLVKNLTRDDFMVFDDGKRQEVTVFSAGLQPITVVLMLDTSNSMTMNVPLMKQATEQFLVRLLPGDRARVGSFSDRITISPRFTGDRDELLRIVENDIEIGNPTRLWDAIDQSMSAIETQPGRRVTVVFTDGADTMSKKTWKDVARRGQIEALSVYVVSMRGNFRLVWDRPTSHVSPSEELRRLAAETAGEYFSVTRDDDLTHAMTRIAEDLHYQYVLGFTPGMLDDQMHTVDVRVRVRGLAVRARTNYRAAEDRRGS